MADHWPEYWNEASPDSPWMPASKECALRWKPYDMARQPSPVFLGQWGGYDVWTYAEGRPGISLVCRDGNRTGYFPVMGLPPRDEGRKWVDGALTVCRDLGLWPKRLGEEPYGRRYGGEEINA